MLSFKIFLPNTKDAVEVKSKLNGKQFFSRVLKPVLNTTPNDNIELAEIIVPKIKSHIFLRTNTTDAPTFSQIFIQKDYDLQMGIKPKLIIDGGANVGYASVWFANKFPEAKIFAVEPEDENFKILKSNTKKYANVKLIKAGLWHKRTFLKVLDKGYGKWGFVTEEVSSSGKGIIQAMTIDDILKKSGCDQIDILKLDVESAEKEIFSKDYDNWLPRVRVLIIEIHDWIKVGCSDSFYSAIKKYDFKKSKSGENIVLTRIN